jgi:hypothetical protein
MGSRVPVDHGSYARRAAVMARKPKRVTNAPIVQFDFKDQTYQIDADNKKVYRRFVEIETSKAAAILAVWRSNAASA